MVFCLVAISMLLSACGDQALFDELATNRLKVKIKCTYESNGPRDWETVTQLNYENDTVYLWPYSDQVDPDPEHNDEQPTVFMLDLAGIKVAAGKHSQYFANQRETYSASLSDEDNPLFNGDGIEYENDDIRSNFGWESVQLYIRKMLFNNAKQFSPKTDEYGKWTFEKNVLDMFHEETVEGFNFNLAQVLAYSDYLKNNYTEINRIFPLTIPVEDGLVFNNKEPETVLEIRLVVKNFVKKYEYEYTDSDSNRRLRHFYALSDWLRTAKRDEANPTTYTAGMIGGNLLAVARTYVPGKTATISGNATGGRYVIAIKHDKTLYERTSLTSSLVRPDSLPAYLRPDIPYDEPKIPRVPLSAYASTDTDSYIAALLQYYLEYEVYKKNYDEFVAKVDSSDYELEWTIYDTAVTSLKIPQLVTWCESGTYSITNVPAGTYNVYEAAATPVGELPNSFPILLKSVTITEADYD
ncbi:MAG: hypothetical protein V1874_11745 [Spirochaetota bacterium]